MGDATEIHNFSENFYKLSDVLYCERLPVRSIQHELEQSSPVPTPFYLFSKRQIIRNIEAYKEPLQRYGINHLLGYAVKANYNPSVLQIMKENGCTAVTVSGLELQLALHLGFPAENIILNGTGKETREISLAVENGCMLNIDSIFDLSNVITVAKTMEKTARVILRINPDIDTHVHPFLATGLAASKFGIEQTYLNDALALIKKEPDVIKLVGLHCHLGSTIKRIEVFKECAEVMLKLIDYVRKQGFDDIKYLNLGGGLGIDYEQQEERTTFRDDSGVSAKRTKIEPVPVPGDLIEAIQSLVKEADDLCLILEPGRSLVGNSCILVARVLGVKNNGKTRFIVTNASMNEVIRPCLYSAYHHIELVEPPVDHTVKQVYDIVGPVCECADFIGKNRYLPTPDKDSSIAVFDVGAYCASMGSNYNMRVKPAEILVDGDKWKFIRKADTYKDIIAPFMLDGFA